MLVQEMRSCTAHLFRSSRETGVEQGELGQSRLRIAPTSPSKTVNHTADAQQWGPVADFILARCVHIIIVFAFAST